MSVPLDSHLSFSTPVSALMTTSTLMTTPTPTLTLPQSAKQLTADRQTCFNCSFSQRPEFSVAWAQINSNLHN